MALTGYGETAISGHLHPCGAQAPLGVHGTRHTHAERRCASGTESPLFRTRVKSFLREALLRDLSASSPAFGGTSGRIVKSFFIKLLTIFYLQSIEIGSFVRAHRVLRKMGKIALGYFRLGRFP